MFSSSEVRKLSRSEEMFAETQSFVGLGAHVQGPIDADALSDAVATLLEAHPVLGGHLECDADGRHHLAVDDLQYPDIEVVDVDDQTTEDPPIHLDQSQALFHVRLTMRPDEAQPTLYIHHSLADGHHEFALIEKVFSHYTDLVSTGRIRPVTAAPAPDPLEAVLIERGIHKQQRSGLERFWPAMFAYDLPPSRRSDTDVAPESSVRVPKASCRLSEHETHALVALGRSHRLGLNALISAVVLLAEWQLRGQTNVPVPYIYPVDLRYVLSPPVSATGCTNPMGVATYLAEIHHDTGVVGLARDIAEAFRADLSDGVIQQSLLHFSPQYVGNPPGLPDIVMLTDNGPVPPIRTPPGVELTGTHGELFFAVNSGIDMYMSKIFAGQLEIEYYTHAPEPERSTRAIHSLLCSVAEQHLAAGIR